MTIILLLSVAMIMIRLNTINCILQVFVDSSFLPFLFPMYLSVSNSALNSSKEPKIFCLKTPLSGTLLSPRHQQKSTPRFPTAFIWEFPLPGHAHTWGTCALSTLHSSGLQQHQHNANGLLLTTLPPRG